MSLYTNKDGIIIKGDKTVGTPCGYCPNVIHLHQESGGVLHTKNGKPMCARCRILTRSKFANKIRADKKLFEKDIVERREYEQEKADKSAQNVAIASQKRSDIDSTKKKKLMDKLQNK